MRTRTFVFSFFVHATMIGMAMVVRIFATTELPDPPQSTTFMMATPDVPEVQPPPVRAVRSSAEPAISNTAVPITEPESLAPEPPRLVDAVLIGDNAIIGTPGDSVGDLIGEAPPRPAPRATIPPPISPE